MGGYGSGRDESRCKVESCIRLDVNELRRKGAFRAGVKASGSLGDFTFDLVVLPSKRPHRPERVLLKHAPSSYYTGEPAQRDPQYEIALEWTVCHLGGERPWFRCPNTHCQRRVVHLLLPPGGLYFLCRQCYRLAYGSQAESRDWRANRKAAKIRHRLGGGSAPLDAFPFPPRPKGMHRRTYDRLERIHDDAMAYYWQETMAKGERLVAALSRRTR